MSDAARLAWVIGALLVVPGLVVLLVAGGDDTRTFRRDPAPEAAATPAATSAPSATPGSTLSPTAPAATTGASIEATELPSLTDACEDEALLDEEAREAAFRDGLEAERNGAPPSSTTERWLDTVTADLERCAGSLGPGDRALRRAMARAVEAADSYGEALAAPEDNSVNRAWSELGGALDEVIVRWFDA